MILRFKLLAIIAVTLFLASCGNNNNRAEYDTVREYLKERLGEKPIDSIRRVFVLTENGCEGCNKTFVDMAALEVNNPQTLIIVRRMGAIVDVSQFEGDSIRNVIFDNRDLEDDTLFVKSRFMILGKDRIDTMLTINAQTLYQDIEYIMQSNLQ